MLGCACGRNRGKVMNEVTYCREGKGGTDAKNDRIALEIFS